MSKILLIVSTVIDSFHRLIHMYSKINEYTKLCNFINLKVGQIKNERFFIISLEILALTQSKINIMEIIVNFVF